MAATKHYIETVAGVTRHMVLRLANQDGTPATAADYAIYGAARQGDRIHPFGAAPMDPSSVRLSIPPLEASNYTYDLFAKHTATGIEHALLCGSIRVADRVASMPPADQGGEHIEAAISSDLTDITVTVQIVPVITAATWEAIEASIATADTLLEQASSLLPEARQEIATATGTAKQDITAHAASATAAAKQEINQTAGQAAADTADIIAASGEAATSAVRQEASSATSAALTAISTAEATVIAQATNDGINAIGQSITAGTGTISEATASGKSSIDTYIATIQADIPLKSQANSWTGVQTINAPLVINGSATTTYTPISSGAPVQQADALASLGASLYAAGAYGPMIPPITGTRVASGDLAAYKTTGHIACAITAPNAAGAWRTAYLYMLPSYARDYRWIAPSGSYTYRWRQSTIDCIRIAPGYIDLSIDAATIGRPVMVGIWASRGDGVADTPSAKPILRRPWDVTMHAPPIHGNSGQPHALECCAAYGHAIPSILVSSGSAAENGNRPAVRYTSPIDDPAGIREIWTTHDGSQPDATATIAYIRTHSGLTVAIRFGADSAGGEYSVVARAAAGKRSASTCGGIAYYPNLIDLAGADSEGNNRAPYIHPVQVELGRLTTHNYVANATNAAILPPNPGASVVLDYVPAASETTPQKCYTKNHYGRQLTIAAAAQTIAMTLPGGVIADVDTWSTDWCILDGTSLRITANTTGASRYVSIWYYDPTIKPSLIFEIGITQLA